MEVTAADIDGVDAVAIVEQLRSHDGAQRPMEEEANRCIMVAIGGGNRERSRVVWQNGRMKARQIT